MGGRVISGGESLSFFFVRKEGRNADVWYGYRNNLHPASAAQVMFGDDVAQLLNGTVW